MQSFGRHSFSDATFKCSERTTSAKNTKTPTKPDGVTVIKYFRYFLIYRLFSPINFR